MSVYIAQGFVFVVCGLLMFLYVHLFSAGQLTRHIQQQISGDARQGSGEFGPALPPVLSQQALLALYREQMSRLVDAKIHIIRSAADTENRVLLMQAKASLESGHRPSHPVIDGSAQGDYLQVTQSRAAHHLAELDQQIQSIPGTNA